jgi:hypothetical protein
LGCWISSCDGPFSLGARFEIDEPFVSLIFKFFFGPPKTADTESVHTGARLYFFQGRLLEIKVVKKNATHFMSST